eukprot:TRINITY_DN1068_c0_g1_i2.p1 TRINITY_DN1068_c0_g1~~TRINITY_DN1068_c0_g1_i2.p1  ORF type:complete len:226 (-),score=36.08 TRINITY_DN1068_c0_g1_i2:267-944(-)
MAGEENRSTNPTNNYHFSNIHPPNHSRATALQSPMTVLYAQPDLPQNRHLDLAVNKPVKSVSASSIQSANQGNSSMGVNANQCSNDMRDKGAENTVVVSVNGRKVRLSNTDSDSLYALCRRWIRNDVPRKDQHLLSERPLPRPLSARSSDEKEQKGTTNQEDSTETENASELEESVENMSEQQLLELHVQRARQIRARLRDKRARRIDRYKQRLALLLPRSLEQD